jgi:EAL domain-containing protein (putative c-di-GMP-specific phosphodiesterase class I)
MRPARVQPIFNLAGGLFYYEWFAGVDGTDWHHPADALRSDMRMLESLKLHSHKLGAATIGVNVSFMTAIHVGAPFIDAIASQLPRGSIIEFTEHGVEKATTGEMDALATVARHARERGFVVALDDCSIRHPFGNPSIWEMLSAQIIKVNMSDPEGAPVATFCSDHQLLLVCENIETHRAYNAAQSMGATGYQGFLLGHPIPFADSVDHGVKCA